MPFCERFRWLTGLVRVSITFEVSKSTLELEILVCMRWVGGFSSSSLLSGQHKRPVVEHFRTCRFTFVQVLGLHRLKLCSHQFQWNTCILLWKPSACGWSTAHTHIIKITLQTLGENRSRKVSRNLSILHWIFHGSRNKVEFKATQFSQYSRNLVYNMWFLGTLACDEMSLLRFQKSIWKLLPHESASEWIFLGCLYFSCRRLHHRNQHPCLFRVHRPRSPPVESTHSSRGCILAWLNVLSDFMMHVIILLPSSIKRVLLILHVLVVVLTQLLAIECLIAPHTHTRPHWRMHALEPRTPLCTHIDWIKFKLCCNQALINLYPT